MGIDHRVSPLALAAVGGQIDRGISQGAQLGIGFKEGAFGDAEHAGAVRGDARHDHRTTQTRQGADKRAVILARRTEQDVDAYGLGIAQRQHRQCLRYLLAVAVADVKDQKTVLKLTYRAAVGKLCEDVGEFEIRLLGR